MAIETEFKFLVHKDLWNQVIPNKSLEIRQGYLYSDESKTIRVRTKGAKGYLTIKGKTSGASRPEYEYEIPYDEAIELLNLFCSEQIEKTRHEVLFAGNKWEVDVFQGANEGLIVAELEVESETDAFEKPSWIGENVTDDSRYANANLIKNPFVNWKSS
jgi:CYTH domain-containing protein